MIDCNRKKLVFAGALVFLDCFSVFPRRLFFIFHFKGGGGGREGGGGGGGGRVNPTLSSIANSIYIHVYVYFVQNPNAQTDLSYVSAGRLSCAGQDAIKDTPVTCQSSLNL